jgi:hypothetical protein
MVSCSISEVSILWTRYPLVFKFIFYGIFSVNSMGSVQIIFVGISFGSLIFGSELSFTVWNDYGGNISSLWSSLGQRIS